MNKSNYRQVKNPAKSVEGRKKKKQGGDVVKDTDYCSRAKERDEKHNTNRS